MMMETSWLRCAEVDDDVVLVWKGCLVESRREIKFGLRLCSRSGAGVGPATSFCSVSTK